MFPSLPTSFQVFPAEETLFSPLGMSNSRLQCKHKQYFKIRLQANVSQKCFLVCPGLNSQTNHFSRQMGMRGDVSSCSSVSLLVSEILETVLPLVHQVLVSKQKNPEQCLRTKSRETITLPLISIGMDLLDEGETQCYFSSTLWFGYSLESALIYSKY